MKDRVKQLEQRRLLQEYSFVKADLEYKQSVLEENQSEFLERAYEMAGKERLSSEETQISAEKSRADRKKPDWSEYGIEVQNKAKKLYREISKITHPDRDPGGVYTEIFSSAAIAYEECNIIDLYEICEQLGIKYEVGSDEIKIMKETIEKTRANIKVIENSFAYMWSIYESEKMRDLILKQFVRVTKGKL
jgi:hypothetical protein